MWFFYESGWLKMKAALQEELAQRKERKQEVLNNSQWLRELPLVPDRRWTSIPPE